MKFECEVKLNHGEKYRTNGYVRVWVRRGSTEGYGEDSYDVGRAMHDAYAQVIDKLISTLDD